MTIAIITTAMTLAIAGCASARALRDGDADPVSSSPSSTPATPAAPPPSATAAPPPPDVAPSRLPALEDLVVAPEGLGSLIVGQPVTTTDMVLWDPDACESFGYHPAGDPLNGRWVANYDAPDGAPPFAMATNATDQIGAIEIHSDELITAEGIGRGSTIEELRAAYPELKDLGVGDFSTLHAIDAGTGRITFEVIRPGDYWAEFADKVAIMRIVASDAPAPLVAATDAVVGGCL